VTSDHDILDFELMSAPKRIVPPLLGAAAARARCEPMPGRGAAPRG